MRERKKINDAYWRKMEERDELIRRIIDKDRQEYKKYTELTELANKWNQSKVLREFITAYELQAERDNRLSDQVKEWLEWAKRAADWHDPLTRSGMFHLKDHLLDLSEE